MTALELIKKWEGCRLEAYQDVAGIWTIGYGHTAGVKQGDKISQAQADQWLAQEIEIYAKYVSQWDSVYHWRENESVALTSFTYNCGPGNLKKLLNNGARSRTEIADAIPLYNKAGGKVVQGLVNRRAEEQKIFLGGAEDTSAISLVRQAIELLKKAERLC